MKYLQNSPSEYLEKVYAGVLGKIIGVYTGRPFEQWPIERIAKILGEIRYYVHETLNAPLVVTDDDITGTFTFLRAMPDWGNSADLTAEQIGQSWLNYIIEKRTILWWGGVGNSTEHTAFLNLKKGVKAPRSGSIEENGPIVAEQIGAQIFIEGWGLICPGDPAEAVRLAGEAGRVSHDGEAVYGAQVIAAMVAQAFVEDDIDKLIDTGLQFIPKDCLIARLIGDIREWCKQDGNWRKTLERIREQYGYEKFGGGCHIIPNHALVIMSLLYGRDSFQEAIKIVNTSAYDTDCNAANVACILGVRGGLEAFEDGPDWRGPVADQMYLPQVVGGDCVTDAAATAVWVANIGRALAGLDPVRPKNGARFHFELPGSVQGWRESDEFDARGALVIENVTGHSKLGERSLALNYQRIAEGRPARVETLTSIFEKRNLGYQALCSPTIYSGQRVTARLSADAANASEVSVRLFVAVSNENDDLVRFYTPAQTAVPGEHLDFAWTVPETNGYPIGKIGVEVSSEERTDGTLYLDFLDWEGSPAAVFRKVKGENWIKAWTNAFEELGTHAGGEDNLFAAQQNEGLGLAAVGTRDWRDYRVTSTIVPHFAHRFGIAARFQGLRRFLALILTRAGKVQLVRFHDGETLLAESDVAFDWREALTLTLEVKGKTARGFVDGKAIVEIADIGSGLNEGGVATLIDTGTADFREVTVEPLDA